VIMQKIACVRILPQAFNIMLELYDCSPYSLPTQKIWLKAACGLSNANVKCLVWGDDALAFIHFVPTILFGLHLVVADADLEKASNEIIRSLPFKIYTGSDRRYVEFIYFDASQPRTFPHSVHLEPTTPQDKRHMDDPEMIFIHPQSQLYLDVNDNSRSVSLPSFPDTIRFPTRTAFLDSLIETYLDPPVGRVHTQLRSMLSVWISYFFVYALRNRPTVLPSGDLEPEHVEVLQSLRPENRPYFEAFARDESCDTRMHALRRKEILEKLGYSDWIFLFLPRRNCLTPLHLLGSLNNHDARFPYLPVEILHFGQSYFTSFAVVLDLLQGLQG